MGGAYTNGVRQMGGGRWKPKMRYTLWGTSRCLGATIMQVAVTSTQIIILSRTLKDSTPLLTHKTQQ